MPFHSELPKLDLARPILTHLNADTAWLISFPRPSTKHPEVVATERSYYHVIVDPWLDGEYVVGIRWFMAMNHAIQGSYRTVQQVQELVLEIEAAAGNSNPEDKGHVDAIFVSHYLGDHCDRGTLEQIDPSVPLISIKSVVEEVKKWNHFHTVEQMSDLDINALESLWQTPVSSNLPDYIRVGRIPDGGSLAELHWATLIAFSPSGDQLSSSDANIETILYSPHGIYSNRFTDIDWATKHSKLLALLHGLKPAWSPQVVNLGVENGSKLALMLKPKYWFPTHDEELEYQGFLGWFQTKTKKTFADVDFRDDDKQQSLVKPICKELENGEIFVLA
jgi:hypothetical protein